MAVWERYETEFALAFGDSQTRVRGGNPRPPID
jgi:hypothetical protein